MPLRFPAGGAAFIPFTSGDAVIEALTSGTVDIALGGSWSVAAGYSREVDLQVIHVQGDIKDAEALVVNDTITAPQDLKGKTIAAPFGSTTHFHLLFALEQLGIDPGAVKLVDLSPPDMAAEHADPSRRVSTHQLELDAASDAEGGFGADFLGEAIPATRVFLGSEAEESSGIFETPTYYSAFGVKR